MMYDRAEIDAELAGMHWRLVPELRRSERLYAELPDDAVELRRALADYVNATVGLVVAAARFSQGIAR